ncbi:MAG TPA: helix-turn-helix domain-containing protein [Micromonosporaceae bacterium]
MMSQRGNTATGTTVAPNAIDEERILHAAYQMLLAVGMRRVTMADISRRAGVSRATLYRRWPNVRAVVAALMTRESAAVAAASFDMPGGSARGRLVEGIVSAVRRTRAHPLLRKIVEVDPEFLLPYLLERRGSSTDTQLAAIEDVVRAGHVDGSVRPGDAAWQARALLLAAMAFVLSGPIMATPGERDLLDAELRLMLDRYVAP